MRASARGPLFPYTTLFRSCETERANLKQALAKSRALHTVYSMRAELASLWERSSASREQLVRQLQDWCHRAEASGIRPLADRKSTRLNSSHRCISYAVFCL